MAPSRLGQTFAALIGSQVIARVVRVVYLLVIARFLAPADIGLYLYGTAFYITLSVFAGFGQGPLLAASIGDRIRPLGPLLSKSLALMATATLVAIACGTAYLELFESRAVVARAAASFFLALAARTYVGWVRDCFVAHEDVAWIPRYDLVFRTVEATLGSLFLIQGAGVLALCWLHGAIWGVEAVLCHHRLLARLRPALHVRSALGELPAFAREALPFFLASSLVQVFLQVAIVVLTAKMGETGSVGHFGVAVQFITIVAIVPTMMGAALLPAIGRVKRSGGSELPALLTIAKLALVIGGALAPALAALGPWLLATLAGPEYRVAGESLAVLGWALAPYAVTLVAIPALNGLGRHRTAAIVAVVMVAVHVLALAIAWPLGAVTAAELSLIAGACAGAAISLYALGAALAQRGQLWWLAPALLVVVAWGWLRYAPLPPAAASAFASVAIIALALVFRLVRRDELAFIRERLWASRTRTGS